VVIITADTREQLLELLNSRSVEVENYIRASEEKRIKIQLYEAGFNDEAVATIKAKYGFRMNIPVDYYIAIDNPDFTWLRKENVFLSSNILLYKRELKREEMANGVDWDQFAVNIRNYIGKSYISSGVEGSYMEIEDRYAPIVQENVPFLDHEAVETQGLWRMEKDFMGGPFKNYSWFDQSTQTYYVLDAFVHAPKEGKKKFMRHLDHIFSTAHYEN
jgi:hypothetical protein